jgi:surface antigen
MRTLFVLAVAAALAGCGLETASTAATAASIKKQEMQEGKKTMERAQQKIDGAMQQAQQRADSAKD